MKLSRFSVIAAIVCFAAAFLGGCSDDDGIDNREKEYGYVQFKLYKEASYQAATPATAAASRAVKPQLDYLSEASKVKVTLTYGEITISQTLTLSAADKETAEYGLRSEKFKLLTGEYQVVTFVLYDANDEPIYNGVPQHDGKILIVAGGLTSHDLTVDTQPRGKVTFTLVKNIDEDLPNRPRPETRAVNRQYAFDEITEFSVTVQNKETNEQAFFEKLPMTFSSHFDENNEANGTFGYETSSSKCDSLLSLPAGEYRVLSYQTYDKNKLLLETNTRPKTTEFTVVDNRTTEVKTNIRLYESDEYIKDAYALYEIWKALDGPNWYYQGENYPEGTNWDFNKDPDLWYAQPGVEVHTNGRIAKISISDFGFRGHMPAALGQLTQLVELYLGTHNDGNTLAYDPSLATDQSLTERGRNRLANHKKFLSLIHPATQVSEPIAFGLRQHNIHIPATALYDEGFKEEEIFDRTTGLQKRIRPMDMIHGKMTNGLKSLPREIGNLKNLEYLFIANGELSELPAEMAQLESCTDIELYNCPKMEKFPLSLAQMPKITSLNISNNEQWSAEEIYKGLDALANGPAKEVIQVLYARGNKLEEVPASLSNMKKLSLLDLAQNQIRTLHPLGKDVAPVQLYLDNNLIEEIPVNEEGIFCGTDDTETVSVTYNKLKEFPNIFTSKTKYGMSSVDFSNNEITGFPADFKGINVETLSLANNPITKFPKCLGDTGSLVSYIILRACEVDEIPEGSFKGKYSSSMISLDLTYNKLSKLPKDFTAEDLPYLYGFDVSFNSFDKFPYSPLNSAGLTVFGIRCQRDANGGRCLKEWPKNIGSHTGLRGLYIGSNDLRKIDDTISYLIFHLEIADNPNITFDASSICYYWRQGAYNLIYDKSQNIVGCDEMLE